MIVLEYRALGGMVAMLWPIVLLILCLVPAKTSSGNETAVVTTCLSQYLTKIEKLGLCPNYLDNLRDQINRKRSPGTISTNAKIVLDVGLGSQGLYSEVFEHFRQLNISGFDANGKTSYGCEYGSVLNYNDQDKLKDSLFDEKYVYVNQKNPALPVNLQYWFNVFAAYPESYVLVNDVSDEQYYDNRLSALCKMTESQSYIPENCLVPMIMFNCPQGGKCMTLTYDKLRLSNFTFEQVQVMTAAYRDLISCIVPSEQRLTFNLRTVKPSHYWMSLNKLLHLKLRLSDIKHMTEMGSVCEAEDYKQKLWLKCANEYADTISNIYGRKFRSYARNMLLRHPPYPHERRAPHDTQRLVLGVGPGTSGTRTIHFSMVQLGMTGLHYHVIEGRPEIRDNIDVGDFDYDMQILTKESPDRRVYWSDTPVPNRWWYLNRLYPRTSYIMTDVSNVTAWHHKRLHDHCRKAVDIVEPSCFPPLPIRFNHNPLSYDFFTAAHIAIASNETVAKTFDAYRALLRCAIPAAQLHWINIMEATDSRQYWSMLIAVSGVNVSDAEKNEYIGKGIPRCGTKGCYWNGVRYDIHY